MSTNKQETTTSTVDSTPASTVELKLGSNGTKLRHYGITLKDLEMETFDLIHKVRWLIETTVGWSEDGTFTFPDGETWAKVEGEQDETDGE